MIVLDTNVISELMRASTTQVENRPRRWTQLLP
jgi:predicted nucleic acid-binding protein